MRRRPLRRRPPRHGYRLRVLRRHAESRASRFRRGSVLVVGLTGLLLLVVPESAGQEADPAAAVEEATSTLGDLVSGFTGVLPKVAIALALLLVAWLVTRLTRFALERLSRSWRRAAAVGALVSLGIWLLALGSGLSVIAGDARALVGSVGLVGLALSWALQAPIESFTGWLLNSFRGHYEVGDRIAVGDVLGDVYTIDLLTTTVWEVGGPGRPVQASQPTGALVTFPNSEILRSNIVNYTRDFPWVWDEVAVSVADDADAGVALAAVRRVAAEVVGEPMREPAEVYARLLERKRLPWDVATEPQVYLSPTDTGMNLTVRYLVPARERRKWSSALYEALVGALGRPEVAARVAPAAGRVRVRVEERTGGG